MNAEALIGRVLGTCTLERLIGQGGMGAVFLAQQSRPRRQVAVKVLLPNAPLTAAQRAAFLERFRRETDALASLEHPNIMPVHEYGEQDGLAYLVMPYVSGGTLRDVMEKEHQLPLTKVMNYLDQMVAALSVAHEHGIIHRDIKPANILITADERLLLTDFGLVKIVAEGQAPLSRLTGEGMPLGTPDYMAPEQVLGEGVDSRADLYSLGIILYQMVTGATPFQGQTPMQIAMQHLHVPPSSPRTLRPELPPVAEQVMLRLLAKRPADRYLRAQDVASAFRVALSVAEVQVEEVQSNFLMSNSGFFTSRSLFDPTRQAESISTFSPLPPSPEVKSAPEAQPLPNELSSTSQQPVQKRTLRLNSLSPLPLNDPSLTIDNQQGNTGMLMVPPKNGVPGQTSTLKLTQPFKVVKVPVAGQPGLYMTGLLPVLPSAPMTPPVSDADSVTAQSPFKKHLRMIALIAALFLVLVGSGSFWFIHTHTLQTTPAHPPMPTPDIHATAMAWATATAEANIILIDSLRENTHNWYVSPLGNASKVYVFENGAYHITDNDTVSSAIALLPLSTPLPESFVYTLSMQEIKGNDTSVNNQFGMILRFSTHQKNGRIVTTFYAFEVANMKGGEYQFWKYDDSVYKDVRAWTKIWFHPFGGEFHVGHNTGSNTFRVAMKGSRFTFTVNGKPVGTAQDNVLTGGQIGMLVNLKGTEVAFSNLLLTYS
jgi:serine/threonine protein kinase